MDISEVREVLGIRQEDLTEDLETYGVEELRWKEKKRVAVQPSVVFSLNSRLMKHFTCRSKSTGRGS